MRAAHLLIAALQVLDLGPPRKTPPPADRDQAGIHRALPASALRRGRWAKSVWRLEIRSPGATGIRIHFRDFAAGPGQVTVSSPREVHPCTGRGDFWSDIVFADAVVVEYRPPAGARARGQPPFRIPEISHLK